MKFTKYKIALLVLVIYGQLNLCIKMKEPAPVDPNAPTPTPATPPAGAPAGGAPTFDLKAKGVRVEKMLFMYKYPPIQSEPNHKMNLFSYKNILFNEDQIAFFSSIDENLGVKFFF